jgi:hypothetical protein
LKILLQTFLNESLKKSEPPFMDEGEICEVLSRIMILTAMRRAKRTKVKAFMKTKLDSKKDGVKNKDASAGPGDEERSLNECIFEPVGIEDFLDALIGEAERIKYLKSKPKLVGAMVAFNHFAYMALEKITDPVEAAAMFMARGAAVVCKANSEAVDFVLPLVLASNEPSYFHWQVKYRSTQVVDDKMIVDSSPVKAFGEMAFGADPTLRSADFDCGFALHVIRPHKAQRHRADPTEFFQAGTRTVPDGPTCLVIEGNRIQCMNQVESEAMLAIIRWLHGGDYERLLKEGKSVSHAWHNPTPVEQDENVEDGQLPVHSSQMRTFVMGREYLRLHPRFFM